MAFPKEFWLKVLIGFVALANFFVIVVGSLMIYGIRDLIDNTWGFTQSMTLERDQCLEKLYALKSKTGVKAD